MIAVSFATVIYDSLFGAVSGGEDVLFVDERAAAKVQTVDEDGHLPRELLRYEIALRYVG